MEYKRAIICAFMLLFFANLINTAFFLLQQFGMITIRPFFIYEYFAIPVLLTLNVNRAFVYIVFTIVLLIDVAIQLSFIFLFNVSELLINSKFAGLYQWTALHYVLLAFGVVICLGFYAGIKRLLVPHKDDKKFVIGILVVIPVIIFFADLLNGRTLVNNKQIIALTDRNIATTVSRELYIIIRDLTAHPSAPEPIGFTPITFQTFANDTSGNQLLVLLESWGVSSDSIERDKLQQALTTVSLESGWMVDTGTTHFSGGTVHAELRELLALKGDYRFLLDADSARHYKSIFQVKKAQGFTTFGLHSYSFKMFQRNIWWRNIGLDSSYFLENIVREKHLNLEKLNQSSPFPSLNDELAFDYLSEKKCSGKKFGYLLTVNTHLPFATRYDIATPWLQRTKLSEEAKNQLARLIEIITYFITSPNAKEWSTILIVGDHMPPYTNAADRLYYSSRKVPYIILKRPAISYSE